MLLQLSVLSLSAQAQNFGTLGTQWFYSAHAEGGCPGNCEYIHFESVLDTVINGQQVNKIAQTYYRYVGDTLHLDPIYVHQQADTVFFWSNEREMFLRTFIFNVDVGDTLLLDSPYIDEWVDSISQMLVTEVIEVEVDGIPLKKYFMEPLDGFSFYMSTSYMDRIGGLFWFFPNAPAIPEAPGPIRCYSDADIDTSFQQMACDYILIVSVDELTEEGAITVHPNPASSTISISSTRPVERIELYDMLGKMVMGTDRTTLDLSEQPEGLYVVTILLTDGKRLERRVIRQAQ